MALKGYAKRDSETLGRRFPEPPHAYRSEFQRDRDRVLHSKAFRRLEKKTQVFAPHYSDHFRNRLTHTIEVSQIARTISDNLGLNTDLCETLALSHDIGHPPYGHEGERVLNRLMSDHGSGFEHNLHALRIVEYFEEKYAAFRGLNLTFEVREGIIKHSRDYGERPPDYIDIHEYRLEEKPLLEAQLIDLADEIAYNTADLDDGYASGLFRLQDLLKQVDLFQEIFGRVQKRFPEVHEKLLVGETVRKLIDFLVTRLIDHTQSRLDQLKILSEEDVRGHETRLVGFDLETAGLNRQLKTFLHRYLYNHEVLESARNSVHRLLEDLFRYYVRCPEKLPERHVVRIEEFGIYQVVCDYIAGMTDTYAEAKRFEIG